MDEEIVKSLIRAEVMCGHFKGVHEEQLKGFGVWVIAAGVAFGGGFVDGCAAKGVIYAPFNLRVKLAFGTWCGVEDIGAGDASAAAEIEVDINDFGGDEIFGALGGIIGAEFKVDIIGHVIALGFEGVFEGEVEILFFEFTAENAAADGVIVP